jgi:sensor domain CHASE-containing protein
MKKVLSIIAALFAFLFLGGMGIQMSLKLWSAPTLDKAELTVAVTVLVMAYMIGRYIVQKLGKSIHILG